MQSAPPPLDKTDPDGYAKNDPGNLNVSPEVVFRA